MELSNHLLLILVDSLLSTLQAIDGVIRPSADNRAVFPSVNLTHFVFTHPHLTEFAALLRYANISTVQQLAHDADVHAITIFLPTDTAFDKLSLEAKVWLLEPRNFNHLIDILRYHVVKGNTYLYQCPFFELNRNFGNVTLTMANNCPLYVTGTQNRLTLSPGAVVPWGTNTVSPNVDIALTDAIGHKIDHLLIPPHIFALMPRTVYHS